jgi:hypothetical protein
MKRIVFIYGLHDPRGGELRYIGASKNLSKRLVLHLCPASLSKNSHKNVWLRKLTHLNLKPDMRVIEEANEANWRARERFWIARYRKTGARLTNTNRGGEGGATCTGKKWTEERRRHISEMFKGHAVSDKTLAVLCRRRAGRDHWRWVEFDDAQLRTLYVERRLSSRQIAKILRTGQRPVLRRLRELGLTRTNAEAKRVSNHG